jgi:outer membrane receptor protein involved in Fe transport
MTRNFEIARAVRFAILVGAATAASLPAHAQTAPPAADADTTTLTTVVVTGSRIQESANLVSISPVTTVTAQDIQNTGLTRVEDMLNNLPQVFAGQGSTLSNGSDGTATVDLHDLGPQRTLVLVNGRRLGPGSSDGRNFSDVNQIPAQLIERIEVLTGGASAVYGADAVSGVVNFIMNTKFEGVKLDVNYAMYQHDQHDDWAQGLVSGSGYPLPDHEVNTGFNKDLSFIAGSNFADNKGNATFYATYTNQAAVAQSKFDYSSCTLDHSGSGAFCGGSYTSAQGSFLTYNKAGANILYDTIDKTTGLMRPINPATDLYNYGPLNYYMRPDERWTAGTFVNYDVNQYLNVYSEFMFTRNVSTSQIAPSGDFGLPAQIPCDDPLLSAQEKATICSPTMLANAAANGVPAGSTLIEYILRRNVEGGGRQEAFTNESYRTVIGARGDFGDAWHYDAYGQYGTVTTIFQNKNYFSNTNITNALDVVPGPGGVPTCASVLNGSDPACVPWNIWKPGGVTPAATNYLSIPLYETGGVTEEVVSGSITGDLGKYGVKSPLASSGLQANLGVEWREDSSHFDPDLASELGEGAGGSGPAPPVAGQIRVSEVYTEARMPLVENAPGADELAVEAGYRYSSYNLGFDTNTFKIGLEWAPIKDIRMRASFNRAVRAPNVSDLYSPQSVGPDGTVDPCWGAAPSLTAAQCARTGVTAGEYGNLGVNSATQINEQTSGNPNLTPEIANTWSYGFVFQPLAVPGLSATVDYYDIKITNAIISPLTEGTAIILACGELDSPVACGLIHRSANGSLWQNSDGFVSVKNENVGVVQTKDIDLKLHYRMNLNAMGRINFDLEGTEVLDNITQPFPGGPTFDCAGYYGATCSNPLPRWRHIFNADWTTPWAGLDLNLRWRYIGDTDVDTTSPSLDLNYPANAYPGFTHIGSYSYFDMSGAMSVAKGLTLRLGVNNILDKDPPTVLSGNCPVGPCNGNTFSQTYDVLGRYLYAHLTLQL